VTLAYSVAELNPLDDLRQAVLTVEFSPFVLGGHHQLEGHGQSGLSAHADAVELAAGQGRLTSFHRLVLARAWTQSGLKAPEALELTTDDIDAANSAIALEDRIEADAILDNLW